MGSTQGQPAPPHRAHEVPLVAGVRGLHSSTFRLNVSIFCGERRVLLEGCSDEDGSG